MRKTVVTLMLMVITCTMVSQVKVSPGVRLGVNNSTLQGLRDAESKFGINGGLFMNVHLSDFYELQVETSYSEQGATGMVENANFGMWGGQAGPTYSEVPFEVSYVSLGLVNKFFVLKELGVNVLVGPSIDINVFDDHRNYSEIDISFTGGIGYELPFGLTIEARYKQGIIDLDDGFTTIGSNSSYDKNYLNSVIQLGVSYKFNFSKKED